MRATEIRKALGVSQTQLAPLVAEGLRDKCSQWLKACNLDDTVNPIGVLGGVLELFMESYETSHLEEKRERVRKAFSRSENLRRMRSWLVSKRRLTWMALHPEASWNRLRKQL